MSNQGSILLQLEPLQARLLRDVAFKDGLSYATRRGKETTTRLIHELDGSLANMMLAAEIPLAGSLPDLNDPKRINLGVTVVQTSLLKALLIDAMNDAGSHRPAVVAEFGRISHSLETAFLAEATLLDEAARRPEERRQENPNPLTRTEPR